MYKRKDYPKENDYVICTVKEISDMDVKVSLDEFENFNGIIPIDELSNRRITNPRIIVKEGKKIVCVVLDVDINNRLATLSLRRVDKNKQKAKVLEYKREIVAYNVLKIMGEKEKIDMKEIEEKIIFKIVPKEKLYNVFLNAYINGKKVLEDYEIDKKLIDKLHKYILEYLNPPKYQFAYILQAYNIEGDGINKLKEFLKEIKDIGVNITYLGSPSYLIKYITIDPSDLQKKEKKLMETIEESAKKYNIIYEINKYERD
ncbi:MAG: S1 RNA-binding domain-containing protein [Nanopusillaceae archaeon]|jgi:translation initiation factor 2 subunit 1